MTISYSDRFSKLLWRWKGSLWKTLAKDLIIFLVLYYIINLIYRFGLGPAKQKQFEKLAYHFNEYTKQIPLTFLLGFYVGMVVKRWWEQFQYISWPDSFLFFVSAYIRGNKPDARAIRRALARYTILSMVLAWRTLSSAVMKRFPTDQHLIDVSVAGLLTEDEHRMYKEVKCRHDPHKGWAVPIYWMQTICVKCFEQKRLTHTNELKFLLDELDRYRRNFVQLFLYDWVSIPLVYTQVATIATYGYFAMCLIARQYPSYVGDGFAGEDTKVDVYIPFFSVLQFLFYVGWLKVGEDLMNPFGEDDEDFELNYLLDRHTESAFLIVDVLHGQMPPIYPSASDQLDCLHVPDLPHTGASKIIPQNPMVCHVDVDPVDLSDAEKAFVTIDIEPEEGSVASSVEHVHQPFNSAGSTKRYLEQFIFRWLHPVVNHNNNHNVNRLMHNHNAATPKL